jgi:uncharacterized membrane protein YbhN (UPF0104 family)
VLVAHVGTEPFVRGLRTVDPSLLAVASVLTLVSTVCVAARWRLVARELGVGIGLAPAVAAYYRAQLLNLTLPGGVLGDVHRGVRHGRGHGDVGGGLRAVAWERLAGQSVQVLLTVGVLLLLPTPLRRVGAVLIAGLALVCLGVILARVLRRSPPRAGASLAARVTRAAGDDLRGAVLARPVWPWIAAASAAALAGHVLTFFLAARATGADLPAATLVPVALLVLLAAAVPTNLAGWGPREGAAAWTFAAVGLEPAQGVAAAATYGVVVLVAALPGAVVLAATALGGARWAGRAVPSGVEREEVPAHG